MSNVRKEKATVPPPATVEATEGVPAGPGGPPSVSPRGYLHLHHPDRAAGKVDAGGLLEEARRFPALFEFLTTTLVEGKPREPASVILFVEAGYAKVCLSDRHTNRVCFQTSGTFLEALEALEENLEAGCADWRQRKGWKGK